MQKLQLPQPGLEAQVASQELVSLIKQEISANSDWISFARYMELALYAPRFGYYTGGAAKLGQAGDFTTAPEMSPLFGATLATFAMSVFPQTTNQIMEFGAGTGKLAVDLLTELHRHNCPPDRYYIVELSGELRARQEELLRDFSEVVWLENIPATFSGLVLGNEVLDAMPVHLVRKTETGWNEVGVTWQDSGLQWAEKPWPDLTLLKQIPLAEELPVGYLTELHVTAKGFMRSVAQMLSGEKSGLVLFLDYGFPASEYYLDQRDQGTLMCHYRHHAHTDPLYWPGLQDITSHVDFSAMCEAGQSAGLELLCYTSQAGFLLQMGIGDLLLRTSPTDPMHYLPKANALKKLVSPAEMGELFKVLIMGVNVRLQKNRFL
ncbi:MAG: class SAM-dependent methyltransferase [Solimicrobium sp.]|nr:class SAM-dependent methyltransferase [Solimicrobium sp.]